MCYNVLMDINGILKGQGFKFNKGLGQNFILDSCLLSGIATDASITADDCVLEIGAGAGTLTRELALKAKKVVSFEIDRDLKPILAKTLDSLDNVEMVFEDVMKCDMGLLTQKLSGEYKLVANLPYYITTPIIFKFLYETACKQITIMVQKEVADRICATAGSKDYGALSAGVQAQGDAKIVRAVGRECFTPSPDVDSAVVNIVIKPKCDPALVPQLRRTIAAAFAMRRKTLVNNLMAAYCYNRQAAESVLSQCNIGAGVRGETLTVQQFIDLAQKIENSKN